jgi:MFS family permease
MMDNLGAILGPLLGIALVAAVGVRGAILLSIIPGLLAVVAIVYAIRAAKLPATRQRQPIRIQVRPVLRGELGRLLGTVGAFELGNIAATLLILRASDLLRPEHGADSAAQLALVLYTAYNIAATLISVPAGRHGDRRHPVEVLAGGTIAFAAAYIVLALTGASMIVLAAGFILAGIGIGCVETAEHAAVATLAPENLRGSAFGLLATAQSLGNFVASSLAGLLWTLISPAAAFVYAATLMLIALAAFAAAGRPAGEPR